MSERVSVKAAEVTTSDKVLRYGMWFTVENIKTLPAQRGGDLVELWLQPIGRGGACTLALFPNERVTIQR